MKFGRQKSHERKEMGRGLCAVWGFDSCRAFPGWLSDHSNPRALSLGRAGGRRRRGHPGGVRDTSAGFNPVTIFSEQAIYLTIGFAICPWTTLGPFEQPDQEDGTIR